MQISCLSIRRTEPETNFDLWQINKKPLIYVEKCAFSKVFILERMKGIEPSYPAWEAGVLPLNYIRIRSCARAISATEHRHVYYINIISLLLQSFSAISRRFLRILKRSKFLPLLPEALRKLPVFQAFR